MGVSRRDSASAADACEYELRQRPQFHRDDKGKRPPREIDAAFAAESREDRSSIQAAGRFADSHKSRPMQTAFQ